MCERRKHGLHVAASRSQCQPNLSEILGCAAVQVVML